MPSSERVQCDSIMHQLKATEQHFEDMVIINLTATPGIVFDYALFKIYI